MYDIAESIIKSLFQKLQDSDTRALKRWAILTVTLTAITVFVLNFSLIFIGVGYGSGVSPATKFSLTVSSASGESGFINLFGMGIVSRQISAISAKSESHSTTAAIEVPWIGFASKQLVLQTDKNVDKVSGPSPECTSYDAKNQKVLSFGCNSPKYLVSAVAPTTDNPFWDNKAETSLPEDSRKIIPYASGVLGIARQKDRSLYYSDGSGAITYLPTPGDLDYNQLIFSALGSNAIDPASNRFTIATPTGDVYIGSLTEKGTYSKFPHINDFNQYQDTSTCVPTEITTYCYFGAGDSAKTSKLTDSIVSIKTLNDKITFERSYFDKNISLDSIYVTASGMFFGLGHETLFQLKKESGYIHPQVIATSVKSVSSGIGLNYIKDNSVFTFNEKQGLFELEFTSPHLDLVRVDTFGGERFLTGKIKNTTFYHKYKLNGQIHGKGETRLVDLVPLTSTDSADTAPVIKSDYSGNTVAIQVTADITSNKKTGKITYDEQAFNLNKDRITNKLSELSITPPNFTLVFAK